MRSGWGKIVENRNRRGFSLEPCATLIGDKEHARSARGIAQLPDLISAGVQNFTSNVYIGFGKSTATRSKRRDCPAACPPPKATGKSQKFFGYS